MSLITTIIYQPFFNLLVGYYYLLDQIPGKQADMGVAVILLTLTIRFLLLPLTISSTRTKKERRAIEENINKIRTDFANQPHQIKSEIKKTLKSNRRVIASEITNFTIQIIIFFILFRIFTTGLLGADLHLLYNFMPTIDQPFNLMFLGKINLTRTNVTLNLIQSFTILAVEVISLINSPFPTPRADFIRYTIILPIASFIIFMFLPAGKKLFVITTLWFSFFYILTTMLYRQYLKFVNKWETLGIRQQPSLDHHPTQPKNTQTPTDENPQNLK